MLNNNNIPVIICSSLSLVGQMIIIFLFLTFKQLRQGLIPRIILYLNISGINQTLGILGSSFIDTNCTIFGLFRLYGGLSSLIWSSILIYSIKSLFSVLKDDSHKLYEVLKYLNEQEQKFLFFSYGIPLFLIIYPLITAIEIENKESKFCLFYHTENETGKVIVQLNIQKLLFWIIPIILYLFYSLTILKNIRNFFQLDNENQEIYKDIKQLIKQLSLFPIIAFICTFSFTVEDIQSLFMTNIGNIQTTISFIFLSFWGLLNCLAYLSLEVVQLQIQKWRLENFQIPDNLLNEEDLRNTRISIASQCYYYNEKMSLEKSLQLVENL